MSELNTVLARHLTEAPVKLGSIAHELGIEVFKSSLKPEISGLIEPSPTARSGYRIRINRHEVVERQRFTLAHELAHFILHRSDIGGGLVDDVMYRSALSSRKEVEANRLASEIIMPDSLIASERAKLRHLPTEEFLSQMAKKFRVSKQAMQIKLGL
jgi:Zn-dependent peptidase ImmA (M78 family)